MAVKKSTEAIGGSSSHIGSEEHARAEAMFDSIGTGAITTDEKGKIDRINIHALELLGYRREELMGKWFPKALIAKDENRKLIDPINRPITRAFVTGKPVNALTYYKTKSGSFTPVNVNVSPIILNDRPVGAIEVFEDVSLELEIDRMKSEFISIASHQLRTPLTAISVYAQMLVDGYKGELNNEQRESLNTIIKSSQRMNKLISALLDISKMETGKINIKYSKLDLKAILHASVKELEQDAIRKEIRLTFDIEDTKFVVNSDALLVGEIYSNLISNAIKYTPPKGKIKLSLRDIKNEYVLRVKDNGYGIPASFRDRIFTKFARADNVENVDTDGSGLGLYMAKEIANVLNGRLWFRSSEKQKGTSFYFALPKPSKPA
ncbi:MAG TPA: PAS domain-containing sensor histidine kinase [Patescibacteria group bacterium]|nr:PAS domain-containing sensor histidine kinase [Patescibacteria group bacterium]